MINEKILKNYILKRFAITLVIVGILQLISNFIFINVINPILAGILKLDLNSMAGFREVLFILLILFVSLVVSPSIAFSVGQFLSRTFDLKVTDSIYHISQIYFENTRNMKGVFYALLIVLCFVVLVIVWLLPYIIGGLIFTASVSKKVKELENHRIKEEKEAERQKNLLLSDMAHDIKTPITTIAGFSQALCEGAVEPEKQKEYLTAINKKSLQTVDMVTLLFEYVKLDSIGFKLTKTTEDICEIVRCSIAALYTDFESRKMELDINISEEGIFLQVDRLQMLRVFNNIMVNALKHNPEGTGITISVEKSGGWVLIQISDNGTWIDSEIARHIFDPYVQGDKSRTGGKGTGLGLSITRKIVEMHGGRIRLIQYKEKTPYVKTFEIRLK